MSIWIRTIFVTVVYTAAIVLTARTLPLRHDALRVALAFVIVQSVAIAFMLVVLLTRRGIAEHRARRSRLVAGEAHDAVAQHASGQDRLRVLCALQAESRRDVAAAVAAFLSATRGSMQERVATLARDLGISEREVEAGRVIERAAAASLYERALIADELQPRAGEIAAYDIPRALQSGDERQYIAALDLLRAWRVALPVEGFEITLTHSSAEVRSRAFAVVPYVAPSHEARIDEGLRDVDAHVRRAAAEAARKLRAVAAISALEHALGDENAEVATAAAFALAAMPQGVEVLQRAKGYVAFEALEKATLGRLELA